MAMVVDCSSNHKTLKELDMMNAFARFIKDESGATAIEYGLIAALVSVAAIGAFTTLGTKISSTVDAVNAVMK
jgi:pilus assembly protein Flp/PilA